VNDNIKPLTVRILDKEYRVACGEGEEDALMASARYLDKRMREVRSSGKVIGTDKIAVIVALNLAHDLLELKAKQDDSVDSAGRRLRLLRERIEVALNDSNQLEL
jgi:cell division protein ZapA